MLRYLVEAPPSEVTREPWSSVVHRLAGRSRGPRSRMRPSGSPSLASATPEPSPGQSTCHPPASLQPPGIGHGPELAQRPEPPPPLPPPPPPPWPVRAWPGRCWVNAHRHRAAELAPPPAVLDASDVHGFVWRSILIPDPGALRSWHGRIQRQIDPPLLIVVGRLGIPRRSASAAVHRASSWYQPLVPSRPRRRDRVQVPHS